MRMPHKDACRAAGSSDDYDLSMPDPAYAELLTWARKSLANPLSFDDVLAKLSSRDRANAHRRITVLDALPLSPNGKIDRRALPAPEYDTARTEYTAPRNPVEQTLADIWANVLGLQQVGVDDNFFTIGGDSILSMQVVARARQAGLRVTTKDVVASLARRALSAAAGSLPPSSRTRPAQPHGSFGHRSVASR